MAPDGYQGGDTGRGEVNPYAPVVRLAKVLSIVGKLLIWTGSIVLLFVVYQLWGTNIAEARAQDDLESSFEDLLSTTTTTTPSTTTTRPRDRATTTTTTTIAAPPPPEDGAAAARMVIPKIGVDKIVVEGVSRKDLQKGPGHYPETPLPGQSGNAAIAGHRTTYGAPFHRVDELVPGDEILVTTVQGSFTYEVIGTEIVTPYDVEVVEDPAPAPPPRPVRDDDNDVVDGDDDDRSEVAAPELEVLDGEERGSVGPAIAWGAVVVAVWLLFYALSRRWRRWPSYLLGAPVFAITLFVFFEAVAETLPANF